MKKIVQLLAAAIIALSLSNCASTTTGPSCTWLFVQCLDYANATKAEADLGKTACTTTLGSWATTGCTYANCSAPDAAGIITCKP